MEIRGVFGVEPAQVVTGGKNQGGLLYEGYTAPVKQILQAKGRPAP
jgi:hypothetical protein